ncbi:unnamed protein product [Paramecium pentaurelia]|uniref:Transmembrane protein n=1 Tax=Paramecium pentaurelia TaxID=43138 RepID=A0A8S1XDF5_9CILI|nr:unnamed protein product [Paramecium pentaurelia]
MNLFIRNIKTICLRLKTIDQEFKNTTQKQYIKKDNNFQIQDQNIQIIKELRYIYINYTKLFEYPILSNLINIQELILISFILLIIIVEQISNFMINLHSLYSYQQLEPKIQNQINPQILQIKNQNNLIKNNQNNKTNNTLSQVNPKNKLIHSIIKQKLHNQSKQLNIYQKKQCDNHSIKFIFDLTPLSNQSKKYSKLVESLKNQSIYMINKDSIQTIHLLFKSILIKIIIMYNQFLKYNNLKFVKEDEILESHFKWKNYSLTCICQSKEFLTTLIIDHKFRN